MERNKSSSDWSRDFQDFTSLEVSHPPSSLSDKIIAKVRSDLSPSAFLVFSKMGFVHLLVGGLTLLYCPQFGLSVTSSMGLMPLLMKYGESVCMLGCGALFTGVSLLVVSLVLRPEEVRVLKEHQVLQLSLLTFLSLGAFICVGGEVVLSLGLIWALGAILGGSLSLELGWIYRSKFAKGAL